MTYDLIIVGGGLVGSALACALGSSDLSVAVVEAGEFDGEWDSTGFDPRVCALTPDTVAWFGDLGVWNLIREDRYETFDRVRVWDGEGTAAIHFSAQEVGLTDLGYIVENRVALKSLRRRLSEHANIELIAPARVAGIDQGETVTLSLESGDVLKGRWLVGADGALSAIRRLVAFRSIEWDYGQHAIVTTVRMAEPHRHQALHRFSSDGPLAFLPLPDPGGAESSHYFSIVWCQAPERVNVLMEMTTEEAAKELELEFEGTLGTVEDMAARFSFPLRQRHVAGYARNRVVLIGDAAHTIHPLAGQGVNLGYRDAKTLAETLVAEGSNLSDSALLERYQRRRTVPNVSMSLLMEGFKQLFGIRHPGMVWLRNMGVRTLDRQALVKNEIVRLVLGV